MAAAESPEVVIDFESAAIGKPVPTWTEKGVTFALAAPLRTSKAAGRVMFFPHLATNHKGLLNAMANEQAIPVRARFPAPASSVTIVFWASTGSPAKLQAFDADDRLLDTASLPAAPARLAPADPVPLFELTGLQGLEPGQQRRGGSGDPHAGGQRVDEEAHHGLGVGKLLRPAGDGGAEEHILLTAVAREDKGPRREDERGGGHLVLAREGLERGGGPV